MTNKQDVGGRRLAPLGAGSPKAQARIAEHRRGLVERAEAEALAHEKARLDEAAAAERLERAIAEVIAEGKSVTYDMKPTRDDPTAVGTSEVADAIIEKLEVLP